MRKVLLSVAVAASALAVASPAAAQYYPAPQGPVHGYGHGNSNYGHFRSLQARIDNLQRQINRLDKRDVIRNREADRLRAESRDIERQLRAYARNGLSQRESHTVQRRIGRLEQRIGYVLNDGHRWGRNDRRWNDFWSDRDRDGRNDRWEDDRGRRHD